MSPVRSQRFVPILIAVSASAAAVAAAMLTGAGDVERSQLAARWTARASFLVFLIVYAAPALDRLRPSAATRQIRRHRRQWGLGFASAHAIHLAALTHLLALTGQRPPAVTLAGGGFAYLLILAMTLTSNDAGQRALGRAWRWLHGFGIHYVWFVFFLSYAGRLAEPERMTTGLIFAPLAAAALGLRVAAWSRKGRERPLPAPEHATS